MNSRRRKNRKKSHRQKTHLQKEDITPKQLLKFLSLAVREYNIRNAQGYNEAATSINNANEYHPSALAFIKSEEQLKEVKNQASHLLSKMALRCEPNAGAILDDVAVPDDTVTKIIDKLNLSGCRKDIVASIQPNPAGFFSQTYNNTVINETAPVTKENPTDEDTHQNLDAPFTACTLM